MGQAGAAPLIAVFRKRCQRLNAGGRLCVHSGEGRVRLVCTARRDFMTQHDLPDLISRVHSQLGAPMVLVWDHHSSHTAQGVSRELAGRAWLSVVHLPKYAPELNPGEALWAHLKDHLANRAFRRLEELERVLRSHCRSVQRRPKLLRGFIRSVGLDPCPIPSSTQ